MKNKFLCGLLGWLSLFPPIFFWKKTVYQIFFSDPPWFFRLFLLTEDSFSLLYKTSSFFPTSSNFLLTIAVVDSSKLFCNNPSKTTFIFWYSVGSSTSALLCTTSVFSGFVGCSWILSIAAGLKMLSWFAFKLARLCCRDG